MAAALEDAWPDVALHNFRTQGAFLVSAARKGGTTQWIRVRSEAGAPCRLRTVWFTNMLNTGRTLRELLPVLLLPTAS